MTSQPNHYGSGLDLVHTRALLIHLAHRDIALSNMVRR
jgi:hypothetical protein